MTAQSLQLNGTPELRGPRLRLRRMTLADRDAMFYHWASDPLVTRYLSWDAYLRPQDVEPTLSRWVERYRQPEVLHWGIELLEAPQPLIGTISMVTLDQETRRAVVGYCIGRDWWGQGYATEALCLVRDELFDVVGVEWLDASHHVDNPASGAVMRKAGFTLTSDRREGIILRGEFTELVCYAMHRRAPRP